MKAVYHPKRCIIERVESKRRVNYANPGGINLHPPRAPPSEMNMVMMPMIKVQYQMGLIGKMTILSSVVLLGEITVVLCG